MDQVSILIKLNLIVFSGLNNNIIKRLLLQEKLKIMVSFLVLGEICGESLALIKKIDESDPKSKDLDDIFDPDTRKKLRTKFEIIQSKCVKKAKESLERYLQFKLPTAVATVVADIVFENLFYVREDWNKAKEISKFEEVDKEDLERRETVWSKFSVSFKWSLLIKTFLYSFINLFENSFQICTIYLVVYRIQWNLRPWRLLVSDPKVKR